MEKQLGTDGCESPALDGPFGHPYRRWLRRNRSDEPVHLADAARDIASDRDGVEPESVYVELYHVHAPMLADEGVLAFDPERKAVASPD